jgi:hypothetical protein
MAALVPSTASNPSLPLLMLPTHTLNVEFTMVEFKTFLGLIRCVATAPEEDGLVQVYVSCPLSQYCHGWQAFDQVLYN